MDDFLLVKVVLTAALIFTAGVAITLMGYDLSDKLDRIAKKPIGRLRRELEETVAVSPWIITIGAIVWVVCDLPPKK